MFRWWYSARIWQQFVFCIEKVVNYQFWETMEVGGQFRSQSRFWLTFFVQESKFQPNQSLWAQKGSLELQFRKKNYLGWKRSNFTDCELLRRTCDLLRIICEIGLNLLQMRPNDRFKLKHGSGSSFLCLTSNLLMLIQVTWQNATNYTPLIAVFSTRLTQNHIWTVPETILTFFLPFITETKLHQTKPTTVPT